jgi:ATP-binding cassette subfamily F protein uup
VLEDFLDDWPGTLVVVSHDRYFLERVTDVTYGLLDDGQISMLPGGVDDYLARRVGAKRQSERAESAQTDVDIAPSRHEPTRRTARSGSAEERTARKTLARVEKRLEQVTAREAELHAETLAHAADHERLTELSRALGEIAAERESLELEWLEAAEALE